MDFFLQGNGLHRTSVVTAETSCTVVAEHRFSSFHGYVVRGAHPMAKATGDAAVQDSKLLGEIFAGKMDHSHDVCNCNTCKGELVNQTELFSLDVLGDGNQLFICLCIEFVHDFFTGSRKDGYKAIGHHHMVGIAVQATCFAQQGVHGNHGIPLELVVGVDEEEILDQREVLFRKDFEDELFDKGRREAFIDREHEPYLLRHFNRFTIE